MTLDQIIIVTMFFGVLVLAFGILALAFKIAGAMSELAQLLAKFGPAAHAPDLTLIPPIVTKSTTALPVVPKPVIAAPAPNVVIDQALIDFVKKEEGFSAKAYGDFKQYSIGYGTKATSKDEVITEPEALARLMTELSQAVDAVKSFVPPNTPIGVEQGLSDLTYNSGTAWMKAGLGQLVKASDWAGAATRILQYNHAGGEVSSDLTARREKEAKMFTNPL